jgi:protein-S-isoprenylcysteine O-methyltransferase Ste14
MAALALALWALFGITAVVVRVLIHLRRTGTTGVRGISGRIGSAEWLGGVAFVASIALGVAAPVLDQADAVDPIDALDGVAAHVAGLALFGLGLAGVLWSQEALGRSWRIGVEEGELTTLVTGGPFELVRNPIYTAMMAVVLGLALLVPSVVSLVAVALMVIALDLQTRLVEEPYLLRSHGEAYAAYAGRVGRFLPGIGTLAATGSSRPSPQGPAGPSRRPAP